MKYQISKTDCQPIRNRKWWSKIVSRTVCNDKKISTANSELVLTKLKLFKDGG